MPRKKKTAVKLPPYRMAVIKALQTKFSLSKARSYESEVYRMCQNLSKNVYEEDVETVYRYCSYEKAGQLVNTKEIEEVLNDIKNNRVGPDSYYCRKLLVVESSIDEPLIRSGEFPCRDRKCRSFKTKETNISRSQDRSGDEGMTVRITCRVCGKSYTLG